MSILVSNQHDLKLNASQEIEQASRRYVLGKYHTNIPAAAGISELQILVPIQEF